VAALAWLRHQALWSWPSGFDRWCWPVVDGPRFWSLKCAGVLGAHWFAALTLALQSAVFSVAPHAHRLAVRPVCDFAGGRQLPPTLAKPAARRLTRPLRSGVQPFAGRQLLLWLGMSAMKRSGDAALIARRRCLADPGCAGWAALPARPAALRCNPAKRPGLPLTLQPCGCICPLGTGLLVARCRPPRPSGPVVFFGGEEPKR
jgi:hypothetical protein